MKSSIVACLLPLLVSAAPGVLEPRQLGAISGMLNNFAGSIGFARKAYKIEDIPPKLGVEGAKRVRIIYGPYQMNAANDTKKAGNSFSLDRGGTGYLGVVDSDFPKDITVLHAVSELVNKDLQRIPTEEGIYNHHNVLLDFSKSFPNVYGCSDKWFASALPVQVLTAGAGEKIPLTFMNKNEGPRMGYYLNKDRLLVIMVDIVNYKNYPQEAYTSTELEYIPGKAPGYLDTELSLLEPGICGGPKGIFIRPPNGEKKFSVNATTILANRNGYILNIRGHLHDGGTNMLLKINNKVICDSKAIYGGAEHLTKTEDGKVWESIREMTECQGPFKVTKGDKIEIFANYDTILHPSRQLGGHGGMMNGFKRVLHDPMSAVRTMVEGPEMAPMRTTMDADDAEQMGVMAVFFAGES